VLPANVKRYLDGLWQERYAPAYLSVAADHVLLEWGGDWERYGLTNLRKGKLVTEQVSLLEGMLPFQDDELLVLPLVKCPSGQVADIHLVSTPEGCWIFFLDADEEWKQRRKLQQQSNELRLLQHRQTRLIEALNKTQQELEVKRRQSEEASQLKSRFIASMSHELRVPLASIMGYAKLLGDRGTIGREASEDLRTIRTNASHLLALIDNILDQAKIEAGQMVVMPTVTSLPALLEDIRVMFVPLALERGLDFQVEQPAILPEQVFMDGLRLRQIIINLVNNALKFTQQGFVKLHVDWRQNKLCVRVQDSGPGIAPEARERIFLAFHQETDRYSRSDAGGVGLGLAISHHLVRLMGGDFKLQSEPGQGAVFSFIIPAAEIKVNPHTTVEHAEHALLIAEDNEALRSLTSLYLEDAGYRVFAVENGGEAVAVALREKPDLILIDMHMPVMNGIEAVKYLRAKGYTRPILALTASLGKESQELAMVAGCDACLVKPMEMDALLEAVAVALDQGARQG
jgi:signal transduction histidine kinase/CheY-like chemotaxis protein